FRMTVGRSAAAKDVARPEGAKDDDRSATAKGVDRSATAKNDVARARLETMVRTSNGFEIAETDLLLRGPGEFFGTRQAGNLGFHIANPLRDREILEMARKEAFALAETAANNAELKQILQALPPHWQSRY